MAVYYFARHLIKISYYYEVYYIVYDYKFISFYSLNELEKFIKVSGGGLAQDVEEGDYNGLVEVKTICTSHLPICMYILRGCMVFND